MVSEGAHGNSWNGKPTDPNGFEYFRFYFTPIADDFTKLDVADSWVKAGGGDCDVSFCMVPMAYFVHHTIPFFFLILTPQFLLCTLKRTVAMRQ